MKTSVKGRAYPFAAAALATLLSSTPCAPAPGVALKKVISGFDRPVGIVSPKDGSGRLFIVEQTGRIRIFDGKKILPTPFLDLSARISCCGERGLLGLAFHPSYRTNGRLFVYYTNSRGNVVLARYVLASQPLIADAASARTLLVIPHTKQSNHNGGQLQFGLDGYLYVGVGDGGGAGDTDNNAQNLGVLLGKLLRLDVDGGDPYGIPADNPFAGGGSTADDPIWDFGLRNPWRFSFDRATGDLYIADVGQNCWEEVDLEPASSPGGRNYGWHIMEGTRCFEANASSCSPPPICQRQGLTLPILTYSHSSGCSITGGFVYRGTQVPELKGRYIFADYCSGQIWAAKRTGGSWTKSQILSTGLAISTFGEDESGEIYVADLDSGTIYRLVRSAGT